MGFINTFISQRLGGKYFDSIERDYKFLKIKEAKKLLQLKSSKPIIDMGIGEPDIPADSIVVDTLCSEAGKPENRWYADNGIKEFIMAAGQYLDSIFGLENINPEREILHGLGAKQILSILPLCFIDSGDVTLTTVPGYPILGTHTKFLGGKVYSLPLYKENNYYPILENIPVDILKRSKLLYINYPNNPTGQVASIDFYKRIVDFAYNNNIIVVSDASYGALTYNGYKPLSFLSVPDAKEVGVEIHSLSKAFNMTGWRLGFIVGNEKIVKAYGIIKAHCDSGQFIGIQKAGITALNNPQIITKNCERYSRRLDLLVNALREVGFNAKKPYASFYCYVPAPKGTASGIRFQTAEEASSYILENALVSTVPWDSAGPHLRFSVTFEANSPEREREIIQELKDRLLSLNLIF